MMDGGRGAGSGAMALAAMSGINSTNTANTKAAIQRVQGGTGNMRIAHIGDSTRAGGVDATHPNSNRLISPCALSAAGIASALSVTVVEGSFWGACGKTTQAAYTTYNPAMVGNSATFSTSVFQAGGAAFQHALTTGAAVWTPGIAFDRVRFVYRDPTVGRDIVWATDGTAAGGTITAGGTTNTTVVELNVGTGATFISFRPSVALALNWYAAEAYQNAGRKIIVSNMGWNGSTTTDWTTTAFNASGLITLTALANDAAAELDLCFVCLGINDLFAGQQANIVPNLTTLINGIKALNCDVVLLTPNPLDPAKYGSEASQLTNLYTPLRNLARTLNVPLIDQKFILGTWASVLSNSYAEAGEQQHLNQAGNTVVAAYETQFLQVALAA